MIQDVFLETDWDEIEEAIAARDQRVAQLEAEGFLCSCSVLFRATDGRRVFLVEAQPPEPIDTDRPRSRQSATSARRSRPVRREPLQVEYR